jgi:hypothetical protein
MSVSNVHFTDNGLRDFYLGIDDALDSALEGQLEDFRSGAKVPDADGSSTIDEQGAMRETIKKLEQRMADFEGVSIGGFAPTGSEDYPFDRVGLKREFLDEVLAALIQSSNTLTRTGDYNIRWFGGTEAGYLNDNLAEAISEIDLEVYRLTTYRELEDEDGLDNGGKFEDTGHYVTLDAWLREIFQLEGYAGTGLRTYNSSNKQTGVDENWPGGDADISKVEISPNLQLYYGLNNKDDFGADTTFVATTFVRSGNQGAVLNGTSVHVNPRGSTPWNLNNADTDTREYTLTAFKSATESLLPVAFADFSSRYHYENKGEVFSNAASGAHTLPTALNIEGTNTTGDLVKGDITIEVEHKTTGDKVSTLVESGRLTADEKAGLSSAIKEQLDYSDGHDVGLLRSNEGNVAGWLNYDTNQFHLVATFDLAQYKLNVQYGVEKDTRSELLNSEGKAVFNHYSVLIDKIFAKGDELQRAPVQQPFVVTSIPGVEVTIDDEVRVLTGLATLRKPTDDPENPIIEHYAFDQAGAERYKVLKAGIQNGRGEVVDFSLGFEGDALSVPNGRAVSAENLVLSGNTAQLAKPGNEAGSILVPGSVVIHLPGGIQVTDKDKDGALYGPTGSPLGSVNYEAGSVVLNHLGLYPLPVTSQDESNYTNADGDGTFSGGSGYVIGEAITLSNGTTVTVDAVDANGAVTEFTVDSSSVTSSSPPGTILNQTSISSTGAGFTLTVQENNLILAASGVTVDYRFFPPVKYYKLKNSGVGADGGILDLSADLEIDKTASPLSASDLGRGPQHLSGMEYMYYWNEVRIRNFRGQLKLKETIIAEIQEDLRQANAALAKLEEQAGKVSSNPEEQQSMGNGSQKAPQVTETLDLDVYEAMIATKEKNRLYGEDSDDDLHDYVEWQVARTNLKNYIDRRSADAQSATLDYQTVLNRYNTAYEIMAKLQEKLDSLIKTQLRNW